jgi:hypothetical protein
MNRRQVTVVAALSLLVAVGTSNAATGHRSGCHSNHTCPSDHHTYIWFDANGKGWDCARPGADEVGPSDTIQITYDGLPYLCHAVGSTGGTTTTTTPPPPTATTPKTTGATSGGPSPALVGKTVLLRTRTKTAGCTLGPDPDRRCSPGAYYSKLTEAVICASGFRTGPIRYVPQSEKFAVETEYGMAPSHYGTTLEIDHIISLELGGSNNIANLYPESANAHPGYHVKDKLENRLHKMVCAGQIALRAAQRRIATDWEALYKTVYGVAPPG